LVVLLSAFKELFVLSRYPDLVVNKIVLIDMVSGGAYPTFKILNEFELKGAPEGPAVTI